MIKGIYASGMGMRPRMLRLEVIANNLANAETAGFKKENLFVQIMRETAVQQARTPSDLSGLDIREYTDFSEGSLRQTGNPIHLALQGPGFFEVQTPEGIRYTRDGAFTLDEDGTLVTQQGFPVAAESGTIKIPDVTKFDKGQVSITEQGEVALDQTILGKLKLTNFRDLTKLKKASESLFVAESGAEQTPVDSQATKVKQGYLEESNVEAISEMISMVELSRSFETDQKSIRYQDSTLEKANEVGRL